jgi:hypothetical protein
MRLKATTTKALKFISSIENVMKAARNVSVSLGFKGDQSELRAVRQSDTLYSLSKHLTTSWLFL